MERRDGEDAVGAQADEADAVLGAAAGDLVTEEEFDSLLAVYGEVGLVGDALDVDADAGVAWDDDGPQGEQVGADGGDHHGVDAGHDDGAVGGQVVSSGAGGGRDDDAVGPEGGDELTVDLYGEVGHAGDGALGDDYVVEGLPVPKGFAVAVEIGVHHGAGFDGGAVVAPGFKGGVEVRERDLGEEAEGAEVDAEDRDGGEGEDARGREEGSVAA